MKRTTGQARRGRGPEKLIAVTYWHDDSKVWVWVMGMCERTDGEFNGTRVAWQDNVRSPLVVFCIVDIENCSSWNKK